MCVKMLMAYVDNIVHSSSKDIFFDDYMKSLVIGPILKHIIRNFLLKCIVGLPGWSRTTGIRSVFRGHW